jgi:hypothetical protein
MNVMNTLNDVWLYFLGCPDCWAGVIAIIVLMLIWITYRKTQRTLIVHKDGLGDVSVSVAALVHLVKEACSRVGVQQCSDVHFRKNGSKYDVELTVKVGLEQNLADILRNLSHFIHSALGRILGPDYVGKISMNVAGFKGDMKHIPLPTNDDLVNKSEEFKFLAKKEGAE